MSGVSAIEFATIVRDVSVTARANGWNMPSFRSPPRRLGAKRTIRKLASGTTVIAIQLRNRNDSDVINDIIDAVIRANDFTPAQAEQCRRLLASLRSPKNEAA
jgi:hypothetical protein